jgi:hypothetical protein
MVIIAAHSAWCQAFPQQSKLDNPQKKWQLKFSVGADFIPRQFDGFKFYLQRKITDSGALRFGVGLLDYNQNNKRKYRVTDQTGDHNREVDMGADLQMIDLDFSYIGYFKSRTAIKPYFGVGPFLDYSLNDIDRSDSGYDTLSQSITYTSNRKILDAGLIAIMGAEWHLGDLLVLQVEYSLRFYYESFRTERSLNDPRTSPEFTREDTRDFDYYRIHAGNIKTGFSVTF